MNHRPLISDSEKDKHKTMDQLLGELSELRAQLAAKTESLAGRIRVVDMLDRITEPVLVLDEESRVVYTNSMAERLFAKDREAIEGRSLWDIYPKRPETLFYNAYEKARKGRSTGKFRELHRQLGKWFEVSLYPVPGGMMILFNDITVSRQMEELPRLALSLLHNLKDIVFLMRADGRLFHVNNATKDSLGYSSEELHTMRIFDVVPLDCQREWRDILDRNRQHGSITFESRLCARDGHEFPVEVNDSYIELYGSSYHTVSARDITERKRNEEKIAHLALFPELNPNPVFEVGNDGTVKYANPATDRLFPDLKALGADHPLLNGFNDLVGELKKGGFAIVRDLKYDHVFYQQTIYSVPESEIVRFYNLDITERMRNEQALKESAANLAQAQRMAHIGNWVWDTKNDRIYCSDEFYRIFGMLRQDFITYGQFIDTVNPEDRDYVNRAVDAALRMGEHYGTDYRIVLPDGTERIVHAEGEVIPDEAGKPVRMFGVVQDVTERKKVERGLEKYRLFSENVRDIALFVRRDGRILEANEAAVEAYGYTREELLSLSVYDLRASDPGYHVDEQMDMGFEKGILFEAMHRRKDGSIFPVEVNSQGRIISGQKVLLSVVRDITVRKQAEEALQAAKAQAELYVDLMGHDINNMNQIGIGYLEILLGYPGIDPYEREMMQKSLESLEGSSKLIRSVQKLQRASTEGISLKGINATALLENVIQDFSQAPGKELTIDFQRTEDFLVSANELLKDVFVNLIGNAINHSSSEQPLAIGISADRVVERGKTYCRFTIEDNGPGIPDDIKEKLFKRFSRGQTKAKGSGLGLFLVKTLVEHYGGDIHVEDRVPGDFAKGAKFVVTIPSVE